ncbi:maleylpyruvate isomerase family mycothiol-dependent enzyme [Kitasatospora azatica]|uniref:maleylpyruvate isomerase family mycothiol-dependent enzyme n=1 Tax=Kitasatospora azatica TaxID=58347 RepID=UPI00068C8894|nr:maleylpyruvate isomerase family mycothiol-dependent enzyme [Kitasatospora azatica]
MTSDPAQTAAATLRTVEASTEHLLRTVAELPPTAVAEPSALPGWTRGHLLAHLSRNADSLVNLLESARTGQDIPQYASEQAREDGIQQGAPRPLDEQLADLRSSAERLAAAAAELPAEAWAAELKHRHGYTFQASELPWKRLAELEYHHVDLAVGYTPAHWPQEFATVEFGKLARRFATLDGLPSVELVAEDTGDRARLGTGAAAEAPFELRVEGPVRALTAWLSGRSDGDGLQVHRDGHLLADPRTALPTLPPMG